ncbi:MAG TPA: aspartyl/asparaginyl beta-hydroxylase domain-containing protein [Bacteroidia bacterium]
MTAFEFTDKNPKFFYDPGEFSFLQPLLSNFEIIRSELLSLISQGKEKQWLRTFPDYVQSENYKAWKVFSFIFFNMKLPQNAALCPETAKLVYSIPEILSCDYSYLDPATHVLPHKGYSRMVLRCHLPLIVPDEKLCAIRVGNETRHWKEGELMIFDDSYEHEAWNKTDRKRVVLMFDIPNPLWGYTAYEISKYKIENMDDPFLLSMAPKEEWVRGFHKGLFPLESFSDQ